MSVSTVAASSPQPWQGLYAHPTPWDTDFPPLSVPQMFADSAGRFGDRPLVDFLGRRFTYADLHREALAFAAGMAASRLAKALSVMRSCSTP